MWHDNETNVDLLDFQHLVNAVTSIVCNERLLPCTIGINGDWGSGKSSLMKMVRKELATKIGNSLDTLDPLTTSCSLTT
jgi:pantothenate kinase-related protein Tda10